MNWGRISTTGWSHNRHPIPRPNGRAIRCLLWIFFEKIDHVVTASHCSVLLDSLVGLYLVRFVCATYGRNIYIYIYIYICSVGQIEYHAYIFMPRNTYIIEHIEAEIKLPPFRRQHFQIIFFKWKCMNFAKVFFLLIVFFRVQLTPCHYLNQWWLDYRRIYVSLGLNELKMNWTGSPIACHKMKSNIFEMSNAWHCLVYSVLFL